MALNRYALLREIHRRAEWRGGYDQVVTRIERVALGESLTVDLPEHEADRWRLAIGRVAEDLVAGRYAPNVGPYCSVCPFQAPCQVMGDEEINPF